jgi:quercetin dioxygenase-like cupin family protein
MKQITYLVSATSMLAISLCFAQDVNPQKDHIMISPDQIRWFPTMGGGGLPKGAEVAVLEGRPTQAGAHYTIAVRMPDGYRVPPHWHPQDVEATIVKGNFGMAEGDSPEPGKGREMPAGSYLKMPKEVHHYEWSKEETIVHFYGTGPLDTTYINPVDDPRKKAQENK